MTEFQRRLEANIRESLRFAVGEVQDDAVAHMVAGVNAVLDHPSAPAPEKHLRGEPVAWRVRIKSDDPEEWSLLPAGGGADYLNREGYECQPLYVLSAEGE